MSKELSPPGKDYLYMEKWLERSTITGKEYNRFLKRLRRFEEQNILIEHKMSILRQVTRKYNRAGDPGSLAHEHEGGRKYRHQKSAY